MATQRFDNTDGRMRGRKLQERRFRKWTQAKGRCAVCSVLTEYDDPRTNPRGFHLDHIKALVNGGKDEESQTQVLCLPCHDIKTAIDLGHRTKVGIGEDGWPMG